MQNARKGSSEEAHPAPRQDSAAAADKPFGEVYLPMASCLRVYLIAERNAIRGSPLLRRMVYRSEAG